MVGLSKDDSAQFAGTAMLIVLLLVSTIIMGLTWIVISPTVQQCFNFFNGWVLEGWVTDQSRRMMFVLQLIWTALPALAYLGYIVGTIVKAQILKELKL
jgi:hypothetical protein